MCTIPNRTERNCSSEASWEDRDLTDAFTGKTEYEETINKAKRFSLEKILKKYGVRMDPFSRKATCPFPSHKGGRESTASFYFYPDTNTFWCFGCKSGRTGVDFVSKIENIGRVQAALKIINNFESTDELHIVSNNEEDSFDERKKIIFDFSNQMRKIITKNIKNISKIEEIYFIFDKMNNKYELNNKALKLLIDKLNTKLEDILCHHLL